MSTTIVKAIKTSQAAAVAEELESWGPRGGATGQAATSGKSLLPDDKVPGFGLTGIWDCTPGSWTVTARPMTEVSFILSGRARVSDADGDVHEVGPGDVLVLPAGWAGGWEIVEQLRKLYVLTPG